MSRVHRTAHRMVVASPAGVAYGLLADAVRWPIFFPHHIHVEQLDFDGRRQRLRIWVSAAGEIRSWMVVRTLDAARRQVEFRLELSAEPVNAVVGSWSVEPLGSGHARVVLRHHFLVAGDAADEVAWAMQAIELNSQVELAQLKSLAARWDRLDDLVLTCEDSVRINGPVERVYEFFYRAGHWPRWVPHITSVHLRERQPGIQTMAMDIRAPDSILCRSQSVRIGFPHAGRIVYKDTTMPPLMAAHTGEWSFESEPHGVRVVSHHQVVLEEDAVSRLLGAHADLAGVRQRVRERLGRSSLAAMNLAKKLTERTDLPSPT
ncbi:aromatase/cyclase [Streptomyces phaeochromogenes]